MEFRVEGLDVLIVSILVLFLGTYLSRRIPFLRRYNIPAPVTGGLICSAVIAAIYAISEVQITFETRQRDILLLIFFTTIGLSAKMRVLVSGGKALVRLVVIATVFLVVQDFTGVLLVKMMGGHPAYGLFGGSVSLAGGYGTAIAWGEIAEEHGLRAAKEIGIAFATFGLIFGGIIGGPIAGWLIRRHNLSPENTDDTESDPVDDEDLPGKFNLNAFLGTVLIVALCVEVGDLVNRLLFSRGVTLPGFLTAMFAGILITNLGDTVKREVDQYAVGRISQISLPVFLSMSLMSMQLWTLSKAMGAILIVLAAQVTVMTVFAVFVVFSVMGRDYDASVISAGFAGLGLGATPVGIANMNAITSKYGPSPKAFLVIPLVGAFFIDIANAAVIRFFGSVIQRMVG